MKHLEDEQERDNQVKLKADAEDRAWANADKYANPSLVQIHSHSQTLLLDDTGSCELELKPLCSSCHYEGRNLAVVFCVKSSSGLVEKTFSLSLQYVKAKRGDDQTGASRKRKRLEPSAVTAQASGRPSPQDNLTSASQTLTCPPPKGDDPATWAMPRQQGDSPTVPPLQEAGLTDSSPSQDSYDGGGSEAHATAPGANAGSPSFANSWIEPHVSPPAHSFQQQLHHVPNKRQRLDKESSDVAAPAIASSSPQLDHIVRSASLDVAGPPAMGDDPTAESMLLHTARPPCPEFGYTSGASEDQAITPGPLRDLTESELDALLRSPSVPSGSDGPPFADTTGPHPYECCPLSWPLNDHEGLPTVFSSCASPSWYTGSSPDLEYYEEAAADFTYGSDSTQCYW